MFELTTINTYFDFNKIRNISAINFNTTLPQKYRLTPVILKDDEYPQIRQWRRVRLG
jgi:hypothetical protein